MNYDKLAACAPINRQAALATASGEHWSPRPKLKAALKERPPLGELMRGEKNLAGIAWGRLTVVGKGVKAPSSPTARWVLRCACGNYLTARSKTINQRGIDRCGECQYVKGLRERPTPGRRTPRKREARTALTTDSSTGAMQ